MPADRIPSPSRLVHWPVLAAGVLLIGLGALPAVGQSTGSSRPDPNVKALAEAGVETLFADFLHYARMGQFTRADAYARALLKHPDLNPVELLSLATRDRKSLETLLILIKNSTIGDNAAKVLEVLEKGEYERRKDPGQIRYNINELLGGNPQQEFFAIKHLTDSGEYAVPHLLQALLDSSRSPLWPRIIRALPMIGKSAVNPLVMALDVDDNDIRQHLVHALGEIGYVQAVPYLEKLKRNPEVTPEIKADITQAIAKIFSKSGRAISDAPDEMFFRLADSYYNETEEVGADPRLNEANLWYWNDQAQSLKAVTVPTPLFGPIMAMRCCEEALLVKNDHAEAIALWLSANTRRESRLGLNVESGDADEKGSPDPTRPEVFPRALYFLQAAGPRYAHLSLARAIADRDSALALASIEALRTTAGEASLVGAENEMQPLALALRFPDLVVRIRAALALGFALPKSPFDGAPLVIPVLASALNLSEKELVLVIDPDEANRNRVVSAMRAGNREAIGGGNAFQMLDRARAELNFPAVIFLASDAANPDLAETLRAMRGEFLFSKTPVVLLTKPRQELMAEEVVRSDSYVESVPSLAEINELDAALDRLRERTGQVKLDADLAVSLSMLSAETMRRIVVDGRTVFDVRSAEPALIAALATDHEPLQVLSASILALLPTPSSQRAIAHVALDSGQSASLRLAAFRSTADSAKEHGNQLENGQVDALVNIARNEPDLTLRTAASETLGALNLSNNKASEIIRSYHGG